jgi:hypothetical protein
VHFSVPPRRSAAATDTRAHRSTGRFFARPHGIHTVVVICTRHSFCWALVPISYLARRASLQLATVLIALWADNRDIRGSDGSAGATFPLVLGFVRR